MQKNLLNLHPYFSGQKPLVMAHRGGSGLAPENTMAAFQNAVNIGADLLELDIRSSRDDVLLVIHDKTVDRTTNGHGRIQDLTLAEIRQLDAGHHWTMDNGKSYPYRGKGITIPTLEELFQTFPQMRFNIDIKQETPSIVIPFGKLIEKLDLTEQVLVAAFDVPTIRNFRFHYPEILTAADTAEVKWFYFLNQTGLSRLSKLYCQAFQLPEFQKPLRLITKGFVNAAHRRNRAVHVWTVDEKDDMERLLSMGVDGLFTDYPDRMIDLLRHQ